MMKPGDYTIALPNNIIHDTLANVYLCLICIVGIGSDQDAMIVRRLDICDHGLAGTACSGIIYCVLIM